MMCIGRTVPEYWKCYNHARCKGSRVNQGTWRWQCEECEVDLCAACHPMSSKTMDAMDIRVGSKNKKKKHKLQEKKKQDAEAKKDGETVGVNNDGGPSQYAEAPVSEREDRVVASGVVLKPSGSVQTLAHSTWRPTWRRTTGGTCTT